MFAIRVGSTERTGNECRQFDRTSGALRGSGPARPSASGNPAISGRDGLRLAPRAPTAPAADHSGRDRDLSDGCLSRQFPLTIEQSGVASLAEHLLDLGDVEGLVSDHLTGQLF